MAPVLAFAKANAALLSLVGTAASIGTSMYGAKQQKKAMQGAQLQNEGLYNKYSLPSATAVGAQAKENRGQLAQARLGSYNNLIGNLAGRGFGSGSGLGIEGASNIESGYLQSLGKMTTDLLKFRNTRQFAPHGNMFATPVTGGTEAGIGKAGNLLDTVLGYTMMNSIMNPNTKNSNGDTSSLQLLPQQV